MHQPRDQRTRGARRAGVLLLALLQLAGVGLLPAADAGVQSAALAAPTGVEAPDTERCGTHHDHVTCQFCRVLGLTGTMAPPVPSAPVARIPVLAMGAPSVDPAPAGPTVCGGVGSRAPPFA